MFEPKQLEQYLKDIFPAFPMHIIELGMERTVVELPTGERDLRPGNTVSGPTMMGLADAAMYVAILGQIGKVALAVTTNLNISFYRKPEAGLMRAEVRILKLGQRLAVGDVLLFANGQPDSVAHATVTYSIPPQPGRG